MNKITIITLHFILFSTTHIMLCMDSSQKPITVSLELNAIACSHVSRFPQKIMVNSYTFSQQNPDDLWARISFKELGCTYFIPARLLDRCKDGSKLHFSITDNNKKQQITAICHDSYGETFQQRFDEKLGYCFKNRCYRCLTPSKTYSDYGKVKNKCENKEMFAQLVAHLNMRPGEVIHLNMQPDDTIT